MTWSKGTTTAVLFSFVLAVVACAVGGCSPSPHRKTHPVAVTPGHPLSVAVTACRRKLAALGQQVSPTATLASDSAAADLVTVPSSLTEGPTTQSGIFAVYQALSAQEGMTLVPLLGEKATLVSLPDSDESGSFYCIVADGTVHAAWRTSGSLESVDGRILEDIVGNVWTWATKHHYYEPVPPPSGSAAEGVILSLAWAVNEGKPIAPYFDAARISDKPFATLRHWIPMQIQLLPQWSSPTKKEYEVTAWAYSQPNSWELGPNGGFFQVAETSPGQWQIVSIGTGP